MSEAFVCNKRATMVHLAVAVAFCVLLGRLFYLHVWDHEDLLKQVEGNRKMMKVVQARRGNIVDTRGNLLATTHTTIDIGVDPDTVREEDRYQLPELARLLNLPLERVTHAFDTKTKVRKSGEVVLLRWAPLAKEVDQDTAEAVMALGIKGVYGNSKYSRTYPGNELAAHVLGYVNKQEKPSYGIEKLFDFYLRGQDGWFETERDGRRRELAQYRDREVAPSDGLNVELTIDQMVQHVVEREVERLVEHHDPESVSVIVSRPTTGAVMAMANWPTYDLNQYPDLKTYPMDTRRNRALTDLYEPGSTFKIVPVSAGLNEGIVHPEQTFTMGLASVQYLGRKVRMPKDRHIKVPELDLHHILVKSSNVGSAQVGMMLGAQRLHDYAAAFGYGESTECGLGGERVGTLHPVSNWDGLTISRLPMGHAVDATAMQVHFAMSVMANRGVLMEPMFVKRVFDSEGKDVVRFNPQPKRRVVSTEVSEQVVEMLADVVEKGTASRTAKMARYTAAGKTGTTQKIVNGKYVTNRQVTSFSGFMPAYNPELVITIVVDYPKKNGSGGGSVCGPAFKNIAEACTAYLGIRADKLDPATRPYALKTVKLYDRSRRISN